MSNEKNNLKFRFDVSAYRLLGRELITDRITALFELVKNSYDANTDKVHVYFDSVNPKTEESKIVIQDDGLGMTLTDLKDKWMVIGTSSKRRNRESPAPYKRKVVGKKGVGRFAVDKLGAKLLLRTTKKGSDKLICLETDWSQYADLELEQLKIDFEKTKEKQQFFTDIENKYWFEDADIDIQGTTLEISKISETWTESDLKRANTELSKLISPNHQTKYPFEITIHSTDYSEFKKKVVESIAIQYATVEASLSFDFETGKQQILKAENGELRTIEVEKRSCGFLKMNIYYFDQPAKNKFKKVFSDELIDGIKVYRDGLIATPFAEYSGTQNEQKDLLGIDKRRYSYFFDRLGTRDLLGSIEITDVLNPGIIDATNRQDFVDNKEWHELRKYVIEQISQIEAYLKQTRETKKAKVDSELKGAGDDLSQIRKELNKISKSAPVEMKETIDAIEKQVAKTQVSVNKGLKTKITLEEEKKQQESLLFSLISLQTFSSTLAHITRTIIGRIKRTSEFFKERFPDPKFEEVFKKGAEKIFNEMEKLSGAIDFMLKYAKSDSKIEEVDVKTTLENLFGNIHDYTFQQEDIKYELVVKKDLILNYNQTAFEDIIENLISNSTKALMDVSEKRLIKCECLIENDKLVILFSDNGSGIKEEDQFRIFDVFYTTTAEQGGAGMGLFIIKTRLEAIQGSIELVESQFKPTGATFKITFPFKR
ncbi:MAG: ATP-binding protein [Cyclobacteriaceae bacterium]|nr:ATP-binding protein [Cyclobacteriaceae bacterium]